MSITIYTYRDPYKLNNENYWEKIKNCPYFCAAQTLVNGLKNIYKNDFKNKNITTVRNLTDNIFGKWEDTETIIKQHTIVDNIIALRKVNMEIEGVNQNIEKAFMFNRDEVIDSIRILAELDIDIDAIDLKKISIEQRFVIEIYKIILESDEAKYFCLSNYFTKDDLNLVFSKALQVVSKEVKMDAINMDTIVIHGIHQFSPVLLRAIEYISKSKEVVLLFNYQEQYKNAYQTWIDIYSSFDCPITKSNVQEFRPNIAIADSYYSNVLGDNVGRLINGDLHNISQLDRVEILEFDNMTEFANYVADIFAKGEKIDAQNPLAGMDEQIYAADASANDILKTYFPEQFGERQFLNYPLGHFFLAIANMWNSNENKLIIQDSIDIRECLEAGILQENYAGELATIFGKVNALFEGCTSINEMIDRLKKVIRYRKRIYDDTIEEYIEHISYYNASNEEINSLIRALEALNEIAEFFYEDFERQINNFKKFYKKLKQYLKENILENRELNEEFADIIERVLERLNEINDIEASASFECLKDTMSRYLVQEPKVGKGANWIVRNFEQIDGDILRSNRKNNGQAVTYHFACLSDQDIAGVHKRAFPWPLNEDFFEDAQESLDWKIQVFTSSKREYHNFKRYALLYGLEFNRGKVKLSYVRNNNMHDNEVYHILKILGAKVVKYTVDKNCVYKSCSDATKLPGIQTKDYGKLDYHRYKLCKYKFLMESLIEQNTIYKDPFMLTKYLEVILENLLKERSEGMPISGSSLENGLEEAWGDLKKFFPFLSNVNRIDVFNYLKHRMKKSKAKSFPQLNQREKDYMMIKEVFIHNQLNEESAYGERTIKGQFLDVPMEKIKETLNTEKLCEEKFYSNKNPWCKYCADKDLCTKYYITEKD